jgi:preprotein translocase subunit SecB
LRFYTVTEIRVKARPNFDFEEEIEFEGEDLEIQKECRMDPEHERFFQVFLSVGTKPIDGKNAPYEFYVELQGLFSVDDQVPDESLEHFVSVNGSSVLYSTSREVLRSAMSNGPFVPILLPTVSFFEPPAEKKEIELVSNEKDLNS